MGTEHGQPVIIHMGKKTKKQLKKLRKGSGRLSETVDAKMSNVQERISDDKEVFPLIITYRRKKNKKKRKKKGDSFAKPMGF